MFTFPKRYKFRTNISLDDMFKFDDKYNSRAECGGELELVMKDTDEVDYLKKLIREGKDREGRFGLSGCTN